MMWKNVAHNELWMWYMPVALLMHFIVLYLLIIYKERTVYSK